ncbi:DUF1569 domain-containing protein [Mariniflexile litorale]|uniref:DUF1569 domain-containing protein n=1 Tax=Mariniflexile litorale TaxID=3045158 RepID=A0AAU7ECE1_9FLAO|nr:DUF1569 domain-containing protein [Mariniflexile sp. KMM 9835]MDQ8213019.1 DUF1569 domain-containing protein [Mariniflexile sp. KMM 9835]
MVQGKVYVKRDFLNKFPGELFLDDVLNKPMMKNANASPELIVKEETGDVQAQKKSWIEGIKIYSTFECNGFIHPFFGKMTKEQIGCLAYKHTDHHLKQFNV